MKSPFRDQIKAAMKRENMEFSVQVRSGDAKEGVTSFLEKRPAVFPDRVSHDLPDIWAQWQAPDFR